MLTTDRKSNFIILYHRTPLEAFTDKAGNIAWREHKSPNGIIPTLTNLIKDRKDGTWIAWREVENSKDSMSKLPSDSTFAPPRLENLFTITWSPLRLCGISYS